ncbi:hypothetical protein [Arthrobacter bambusae]|uniref:hypothetical protein n=1 Tax=Arthrobacter bambusae TaxID=1338426 RepID=UPI00277F5C9F|nr:hypothetical protein [Arthrobacter bambusae]MDQ0212531.1 hypothetical protein [Arthrobacter bambusae]MDQ0235965.1 hypothetical protein [Arthrobacter bambusae]
MPTVTSNVALQNDQTQNKFDVSAVAAKLNYAVTTQITHDAWAAAVRWTQPIIRDQFLGLGISPEDDYEDVRLWDVLFMSTMAKRALQAKHLRTPDKPVWASFLVSVVPDTQRAEAARHLKLFLHLTSEGLVIHTASLLP